MRYIVIAMLVAGLTAIIGCTGVSTPVQPGGLSSGATGTGASPPPAAVPRASLAIISFDFKLVTSGRYAWYEPVVVLEEISGKSAARLVSLTFQFAGGGGTTIDVT